MIRATNYRLNRPTAAPSHTKECLQPSEDAQDVKTDLVRPRNVSPGCGVSSILFVRKALNLRTNRNRKHATIANPKRGLSFSVLC